MKIVWPKGGKAKPDGSYGAKCLTHAALCLVVTLVMVPGSLEAGAEHLNRRETTTGGAALKGPQWLARQPESNYTLQLLAGENRAGVEFFAAQQDIPAPFAIFSMRRNGRMLYALVQGSYADRAAAEQAIGELPAGIEPWLRSIKSVHRVMQHGEVHAQRTAPVSATEVSTSIEDTAWAWSQNPRHYTVQLVSALDEKAVEAIRRSYSLPGKMAVVQIPSGGKLWYVLVYGSFATKTAAQASLKGLPETAQKLKPWPRSFADLHDAISHVGPRRR